MLKECSGAGIRKRSENGEQACHFLFGLPTISAQRPPEINMLMGSIGCTVIQQIEEDDRLWRSKREKRDKKLSSNIAPGDPSVKNANDSHSSQTGTKTTSSDDGSGSSTTKESNEKDIPRARRTFY